MHRLTKRYFLLKTTKDVPSSLCLFLLPLSLPFLTLLGLSLYCHCSEITLLLSCFYQELEALTPAYLPQLIQS